METLPPAAILPSYPAITLRCIIPQTDYRSGGRVELTNGNGEPVHNTVTHTCKKGAAHSGRINSRCKEALLLMMQKHRIREMIPMPVLTCCDAPAQASIYTNNNTTLILLVVECGSAFTAGS